MTASKYYPNAPIIEAVMDLRLHPSDDFDSVCYETFKARASGHFVARNIQGFNIHLHNNIQKKKVSPKVNKADFGVRLDSTDGKYVIQITDRSFAFSILKTYDCWEDFSKEAFKYWNLYKKIFKPKKIVRQALRYINRIDIPALDVSMEDYFNIYPKTISKNFSSFAMQIQIPQIKEGGMAVVSQSITEPVELGYTSVVLDVDVFDTLILSPGATQVKQRIEGLRQQKNTLFEAAITDRARELIL